MPTLQMAPEEQEIDPNKIRPMRNMILVKYEKPDCELHSGIVIPELAHLELGPRNATVVAVGPNMKDLKKGDKVLVKPYGTQKRFGDTHALYLPDEVYGIRQ